MSKCPRKIAEFLCRRAHVSIGTIPPQSSWQSLRSRTVLCQELVCVSPHTSFFYERFHHYHQNQRRSYTSSRAENEPEPDHEQESTYSLEHDTNPVEPGITDKTAEGKTMDAGTYEKSEDCIESANDADSDMFEDRDNIPGQLPHAARSKIIDIYTNSVFSPSVPDIKDLISQARNAKELRRIYDELIVQHPLMFDPFNGNGYRITIFNSVTTACSALGVIDVWHSLAVQIRAMGFKLSRAQAAAAMEMLRKAMNVRFYRDGRDLNISAYIISRLQSIWQMCKEDGVCEDFVFFTRVVTLLASLANCFDRQNIFRQRFQVGDIVNTVLLRDWLVGEWVVTDRIPDYDIVCEETSRVIEAVLEAVRINLPTRPTFSFFSKLADYYYAIDNFEKMLAVMEDSRACGIPISEAMTAKLMQLASSFNIPSFPELFMEWRVTPDFCMLSTPDISRLLFFYCRSGGGHPCPACGERFNHRYPALHVWRRTTIEQQNCRLLELARFKKGEYEDRPDIPQNKDWSHAAFSLLKMSQERDLQWTAAEWRFFLLCCLFSPRALEAIRELDGTRGLPKPQWDDFLMGTYCRVLRHHEPHRCVTTVKRWAASQQMKPSSFALQEVALSIPALDTDAQRHEALDWIFHCDKVGKKFFTNPYTVRHLDAWLKGCADAIAIGNTKPSEEVVTKARELIAMGPKRSHGKILDSCADFATSSDPKSLVQVK